jgi:hypothetical protein
MAPVRGVEPDRVLLEGFARATEGEETLRIEIRKDEDKNVQREIGNGSGAVRHYVGDATVWTTELGRPAGSEISSRRRGVVFSTAFCARLLSFRGKV